MTGGDAGLTWQTLRRRRYFLFIKMTEKVCFFKRIIHINKISIYVWLVSPTKPVGFDV